MWSFGSANILLLDQLLGSVMFVQFFFAVFLGVLILLCNARCVALYDCCEYIENVIIVSCVMHSCYNRNHTQQPKRKQRKVETTTMKYVLLIEQPVHV